MALSLLKVLRGIALEKAPVSMRALTENEKVIGTEKSEVREFVDKKLI